MSEITEAKAIQICRQVLEIDETVLASVFKVTNLYGRKDDYFLVIFGGNAASVAVCAILIATGELISYARLSGNNSYLQISKEQAISMISSEHDAQAVLIWKPCHLSRSLLYPIWEIQTAEGKKYLNQQGEVSVSLDDTSHG